MITPLIAAVIIGSFWTGVGLTTVASHTAAMYAPSTDVVISARPADDHSLRCHARFHSYRDDMDAYMGYDGRWHVCAL